MARTKQIKSKKTKTVEKKKFVTSVTVRAGGSTFTPEEIITKDDLYKKKMESVSPVDPEFVKLAGKRASAHKIIQSLVTKNEGRPLYTTELVTLTEDEDEDEEDEEEDVLSSDDASISSSEHSFRFKRFNFLASVALSHHINFNYFKHPFSHIRTTVLAFHAEGLGPFLSPLLTRVAPLHRLFIARPLGYSLGIRLRNF
jgi:hypothetical protein